MEKFKFTLEKVLTVKYYWERQQQSVVAKLMEQLQMEKHSLTTLVQQRSSCRIEFDIKCKETVNVSELLAYHSYLELLQRSIDVQKETISELEKTLVVQRHKLLDVVKERKMLERLKGKKQKQFAAMCLREEQVAMDEVALQLYQQKNA